MVSLFVNVMINTTEDDLKYFFKSHMGSKYFEWPKVHDTFEEYQKDFQIEYQKFEAICLKIIADPSYFVGELSNDYAYCWEVKEIIGEDFSEITDELLAKLQNIQGLSQKIIKFLVAHKGKCVYTITD